MIRPWLSRPGHWLAAAFILSYPTVTLTVHGGASALLIAASVVSLLALALPDASRVPDLERIAVIACVALASPLAATLISELWHGKLVWSLLDAPSRFVIAVPIVLALRRLPGGTLRWSDLAFAGGAIASLLVLLIAPREEADRLAGPFLDSIHFGDIALVLGALSALSVNWWKEDIVAVRLIKVAGLAAGLAASALTGARGGWLALPAIALLVYWRAGAKVRKWRWLILLAILATIALGASFAGVRERILLIGSDFVQYSHGQKDTSTGIRLQLYAAAAMLMRDHLLFGLGPNGFALSMNALASAGKLTPLAASFGHGETHNQLLFYGANYGIVGALAGLAVYVVPCMMFATYLKAPTVHVRRAAFMGLTFVVSFFIFGLTVETFDLKMVASFYAAIVGILGGIAASGHTGTSVRPDAPPSISDKPPSCSAS